MPYRYAHHVIVWLLLPVILFAFWPRYFGVLPGASFAFHAHGLTATAWVMLVAAQSWTIHRRRFAIHRMLGRTVFVLVPLFAGGGALAMHSMAIKYVTKSDPFYAALGPLLGLDDLISTTALVLFVRAALVNRRRAHVHGGYLLASVMLVIPPIVARLGLPVPPWSHPGELIAALPAILLYLGAPKHGRPFLVLLGVLAAKVAADEMLGFNPAWVRVFAGLAEVPPVLLAVPAMLIALAALWSAWRPAWWLPPATRVATTTGN